MGLKEIIAASLIAVSSYDTHYQDKPKDKPAQQEEDLDKILGEAEKLYERNNPASNGTPSDKELAAKLFEKVMKGAFDRDAAKKMFDCCMQVASEKFNHAQKLWEIATIPADERKELVDKYKLKNIDQAHEIAKPIYQSVADHLEKALALRPTRDDLWYFLTISYFRVDKLDKGLDAARVYLRLKPEENRGYHLLFGVYLDKGKPGDVLEELKELPIDENKLYARLAEGVDGVYNDLRTRKAVVQLKIEKKEDMRKAAKLFYLVSKTTWSEEMKKEKLTDRGFSNPLQNCYRAGSLDILASENADELKSALNRFEESFQNINKGLDNGLSTLDKAYFQSVFRAKTLAIFGQEKVMEILKEHYKK